MSIQTTLLNVTNTFAILKAGPHHFQSSSSLTCLPHQILLTLLCQDFLPSYFPTCSYLPPAFTLTFQTFHFILLLEILFLYQHIKCSFTPFAPLLSSLEFITPLKLMASGSSHVVRFQKISPTHISLSCASYYLHQS